jgi:hypothetical protein
MELAVMQVDKGEEIVASLVSGHIPGTGRYKFLAKKKMDKTYEWAHFTERDSGIKDSVYRGTATSKEQLDMILGIMNRNLQKIFGEHAEMKPGIAEFRSLTGQVLNEKEVELILKEKREKD